MDVKINNFIDMQSKKKISWDTQFNFGVLFVEMTLTIKLSVLCADEISHNSYVGQNKYTIKVDIHRREIWLL